jgi:hypothetical protein
MPTTTIEEPPPAKAAHNRRRKLMLIPLSLLGAIAVVLGYHFVTAEPETSVPLGASSVIPGGMARINGIVPLEDDGWQPPVRSEELAQPLAEGTHRVRLVVQHTALESAGIHLDTSKYSVSGMGRGNLRHLWSSPALAEIGQGDSVDVTLVFELPDKATALVLEGPEGTRLSLGLAHHSG